MVHSRDVDLRIRRIETNLRPEPSIPAVDEPPTTLRERLAFYNTPGLCVTVIDNGEIAWTRGYGVLEAGTDAPVTADTIFQACSISKHVAMIGALRPVQDGVLALNENVNRYLTSWKLPATGDWQPHVTIRQILSHTAGLTQNWYRGFRRGDALPTFQQVLDGLPPANTPPVRVVLVPGSEFRYSGSHYSVLQQLMMDVTGSPFPKLMHELVLAPLGMTHSSYDQRYPETGPHPAAVGHYLGGEPVVGKWRVIPEMAGAGLWTTPEDLARLAIEIQRAHLRQPSVFLRKEVVDEALTPQIDDGYGLGTQLEGSGNSLRFGHGGSNIGYRCVSTTYAQPDKGAVIMTNGDDGTWVAEELLLSIAREYDWPDYAPNRNPTQLSSDVLDTYVGEFELRPDFVISIRRDRGILVLDVPGQQPITLQPSGDDTFFVPMLESEVIFVRNDAGMARELIMRQEQRELRAPKRSV